MSNILYERFFAIFFTFNKPVGSSQSSFNHTGELRAVLTHKQGRHLLRAPILRAAKIT